MTIITFSGKQYSGKDTAAKILIDALPNFRRCAMGDIIKIEYGKLNNLTYEEIEANKAQLAMTDSLADLGAAVEPLITVFKVGLANALQNLIPGFTELAGGLQDVINGVEGGQERMSTAIKNIVDSILDFN